VTSQAAINSAGEPRSRDMSAETMKMPEPIIEPITIAVAENNPIPWTNCGADESTRFCSILRGTDSEVFCRGVTFRLF
jgi:hypothetical protein